MADSGNFYTNYISNYYGYCAHEWVQNGCRLTWCKRCDAKAEWNWKTGQYEYAYEPKKEVDFNDGP